MIKLFENNLRRPDCHSSKGNQLKWEREGIWYKADYTGYEGLAEAVVSGLLKYSNLSPEEYVQYDLEEIQYRGKSMTGASSRNLLTEGWQIITLERLFRNQFNQSLHSALWHIQDEKERLKFLCEQTERMTGLQDFGCYMTKLLTIDAFFKNEDRHTHNIAVLMNSQGEFRLCPIFDNGAALLADTKLDYPIEEDVYRLLESVQAKTISTDFDTQLEIAEDLYGQQVWFSFTKNDVDSILNAAQIYGVLEKNRVRTIVYEQMRKYRYLFRTKSVGSVEQGRG